MYSFRFCRWSAGENCFQSILCFATDQNVNRMVRCVEYYKHARRAHFPHLALLSLNTVRILQTQRTAATPIRNPYLTITDHRYRHMKPHHRMNSMRRDERFTQSIVLIFANCRTTTKKEWKKRSLFCLYISYRTVCSCPSNR